MWSNSHWFNLLKMKIFWKHTYIHVEVVDSYGHKFDNVHWRWCQLDMPYKLVNPRVDIQYRILGSRTKRSRFGVCFGSSNAMGMRRARGGLVLVVAVWACFRQRFLWKKNSEDKISCEKVCVWRFLKALNFEDF